MPSVALFSTWFLNPSQTFVWEEIRRHTRYEVEVFTARRLNADRFPYDRVHVAGPLFPVTLVSPHFDGVFRRRRFDLVHAHFGNAGTLAMRYASRFGLPLVVTYHGHDVPLLTSLDRLRPEHWRYALLGRSLLGRLTMALCASKELRELLIDIGVPEERVVVHHIGIDVAAFAPGPRDRARTRVVMIGRFVEKKGFEYGIRAFARVAGAAPGPHLTIVGDGERREKLEALVRVLGIVDRVTFAGFLAPAAVKAELARSDVLLAPSVVSAHGDRESGTIVVKEACASHVVPIGTLHGGIPEIIEDGATGYLVLERDVDALADRLARLVADPDLRARMSDAGRAKMEREYDNASRVAALEARYDEARERFAASSRSGRA
ncbi:MAG: glycosyltransferase [Deltaproteobacteria bacterium]|nr:glycosyltransferase [Deltaproteobacteria bacterium]